MPCHIDTIVRINQVRLTDREDLNLTIVSAVGVYPLESEDRELELVLFVPIKDDERDPNTQSIFVKDEYYCIGGKVVPENFNNIFKLKMTVSTSTHITIKRDLGSNRCPLKVSLVGIAQDVIKELNKENGMVNVLVRDYAGQKKYNFTVKIVFPHQNNRFKHLRSSIRPNESVFFVTGQLEVIEGNLYANAIDISYVDVPFVTKRKASDSISSQSTSGCFSSVRSKLLFAHQSAFEGLNKASVVESSDCAKTMGNSTTSDSHFLKRERVEDKADGSVEFADSSISGCCSSKHVRVDDEADDYVEYVDSDCIKNKHVIELNSECEEGSSECGGNVIFENKEEINYNKKTNKGKEKEVQPTVHNTRRRTKS